MDDIYTVLGVRPYSFTDDKTNRLIEGATMYCVLQATDDDQVIGQKVESLSLSKVILESLVDGNGLVYLVGLSIMPVYNKKGKIRHIDVVA